ncbi:MAG: thioredoxin domain-containing protein [Anaerolineae bacterium]|nr:thioredoxin domain-containing protein [Anaerolineae bacterium]
MMQRRIVWWALGIALALSLIAGPVVSGAQEPLTQTVTAYGLSVYYPAGWVAVEGNGVTSLHPADRDVSDGQGPELVLFPVVGQLDDRIAAYAASMNAAISPVEFGVRSGGLPTRAFIFDQTVPDTEGRLMLIELADGSLAGIAYTVRDSEASMFRLTLDAIFDSAAAVNAAGERIETTTASTEPLVSSVSVASVQLPQRVAWDEAGLALYLPDGWQVERDTDGGDSLLVATPGSGPTRLIQATTLPYISVDALDQMAEVLADNDMQPVSDAEPVTVAGYAGRIVEARDLITSPARMQLMVLSIIDRNLSVLIIATASETAWTDFRPIASAVLNSIERLDGGVTSVPQPDSAADSAADSLIRTGGVLASMVQPGMAPPRQGGGDSMVFAWELWGLTVPLPDGWTATANGESFDLALISPAAAAGGDGSFITFRSFPYLGDSAALEEALVPVADQVSSTVVPYSNANGLQGVAVHFNDDGQGTLHHLVLIGYGDAGAAIYLQSTAITEDDDALIVNMINEMVIDPPKSDYAAVDAAWQASLKDQGILAYGDPDAPVSMVEFLSLTCGHCANYSVSLDPLIALEVETGRARFETAMITGEPYSELATKAIYCATEQGKGYTAYKTLFHGYFELGYDTAFTEDGINNLLGDLGLDMDALNTCIADNVYAESVNVNRQRFIEYGLTGTPTILLGANGDDPAPIILPSGEPWSGTIPVNYLRSMIALSVDQGQPFEAFFTQ